MSEQQMKHCEKHNKDLIHFRDIDYCIYCELEKKFGNISEKEIKENDIMQELFSKFHKSKIDFSYHKELKELTFLVQEIQIVIKFNAIGFYKDGKKLEI